MKVPISVLIPTRNEYTNLKACLAPLFDWADEVVVIDSNSTDGTIELAKSNNIKVIHFQYSGGWPKKRQWMLDSYPFRNEWILLLDADEILLEPIKREISEAIKNPNINGYWLNFEMYFLGKQLKYGGSHLWKLFLFRKGKGRYEKRILNQDKSMSDIEVHEHVIVDGATAYLKNPVRHENFNTFFRYIEKHNEYSNWEAKLFFENNTSEIEPSLFGNQAQRRRWLKRTFLRFPGSPVLYFILNYFFKLGFLDGRPGFIFCILQAIQIFHVKIKLLEIELSKNK